MIQRRKDQVIIPPFCWPGPEIRHDPRVAAPNFNAMSGSLAPPTKTFTPRLSRVENLQQDFLGGARRGRKRTGEHGGFTYPYAPWCWNIYQYLPHKSPSHVGKYTIHGAFGLGNPKGTMVISKIEPRKKWWFHQQKCWLKHGWVEL